MGTCRPGRNVRILLHKEEFKAQWDVEVSRWRAACVQAVFESLEYVWRMSGDKQGDEERRRGRREREKKGAM